MKKNLSVILVTIFLSACFSSEENFDSERKSHDATDRTFKKIESKFSRRTKPSESMQVGIPKESKDYTPLESEDEAFKDSAAIEMDEEIKSDGDGSKYSGVFKVGNPYEVFGVSYFPQNYEDFEEVGTASWYGDAFHGKPTANGEIYNMNEMTAAHPTLPLPSMARVTNLKNGKSVIVKVNDRGPFAKNRVMDVSEKAAIALGFKEQGTTQIKLEILRNDTDEMLKKLGIKN